jgi:hypothetical protein
MARNYKIHMTIYWEPSFGYVTADTVFELTAIDTKMLSKIIYNNLCTSFMFSNTICISN